MAGEGVDPARPTYHYSSGLWMNDVIPFVDGGRAHVFFDHNPNVANWGRFRWGHASTDDLVRWRTHDVALVPRRGTDHGYGCWTGSVFAAPGGFGAAYTGIRSFEPLVQTQCIAWSADLDRWDQPDAAVLIAPPDGFGECFRDPFVYPHAGGWRMLVGSSVDDAAAAVLLYESADLASWSFAGPFLVDDSGELGKEAECPELFELGGRAVLVASSERSRGVVGVLDGDGRFVRDGPVTVFDPGESYAARSLGWGDRRIQLAWVRDTRSRPARKETGWSGALSLPRELTLAGDGTLRVGPVAELMALRAVAVHDGAVDLPASGRPAVVPGPSSHELEAIVGLPVADAGRTTVAVGCDPDGAGGVDVVVDWAAGTVAGHPVALPAAGDALDLHIFLDRSIVEVFVAGRVITLRDYALVAEPRLALRADGGAPATATVAAWHLA